jgi:tetratricopeptide (TPR) repeat protein
MSEIRLQSAWAMHQQGDIESALAIYQEVIKQSPQSANAWIYLGIALFDKRQFAESVEAYRRSIQLRDPSPIAWNNLGNSYRMLGQVDQADQCFETALKQQPGYLSAIKNRGTLWIWTGEIERGLQWYQKGLAIDPANIELHRNLGVIYLLQQDFNRGWNEYRWRWKEPGLYRPNVGPETVHWTGQSLVGKRILLYPEQGLGDAIQFVRVANDLSRLGAKVVLHCESKLVPLFSSAPGRSELTSQSFPPPPTDFHVSMIEAIDALYQLEKRIAYGENTSAGYLRVSDALIAYWKRWLDKVVPPASSSQRELRIGINWQGNRQHHADVYRSLPLNEFRLFSQVPGVRLINLQFGDGVEQLDDCSFADRIVRLPSDIDADGGAFTDTAAIVHNLDAVITSDTSLAHLAGSIGTRTLVLLGKVPDWRWGLTGETTPWYSSMELFRQSRIGDWGAVMQAVFNRVRCLAT